MKFCIFNLKTNKNRRKYAHKHTLAHASKKKKYSAVVCLCNKVATLTVATKCGGFSPVCNGCREYSTRKESSTKQNGKNATNTRTK